MAVLDTWTKAELCDYLLLGSNLYLCREGERTTIIIKINYLLHII